MVDLTVRTVLVLDGGGWPCIRGDVARRWAAEREAERAAWWEAESLRRLMEAAAEARRSGGR